MKTCKHCQKEVPNKATRCQYCSGDLKNWFRRHWIISGIGIFILLGMISQGFSGDNSASSTSTNSSSTTEVREEELTEEAITINARDLFNEYSENEIAADQKYDGKILEVSGVVENIGKDILDDMYVSLKTDDILGSVQCMLADGETEKAANLSDGQSVTLKGKNTGLLINVVLRDCVISE